MIEIYDNFIDENTIIKLDDVLWNTSFSLIGVDYAKTITKADRGWTLSKIVNQDDNDINLYNRIKDKILNLPILENKYQCYRIWINANKFSDVLGMHNDGNRKGFENKTALLYGNKEWNINWGAETIFLDKENKDAEIIKSIIPKPGRLVIFDSKIPHTGRVPSSIFPHYRYSVVFNLKLTNPIKIGLL